MFNSEVVGFGKTLKEVLVKDPSSTPTKSRDTQT